MEILTGKRYSTLSHIPFLTRLQNLLRFFSRNDVTNHAAKILIIVMLGIILRSAWVRQSEFEDTLAMLYSYDWGLIYIFTGTSILVINIISFFWRFGLVLNYTTGQACTNHQLPLCTVIVPAYNEGCQVMFTLRSIIRSSYPAEKLQIIALDDGSVDDTWSWIEKAVRKYPGRIEAIRMLKNSGKRAALYKGFKRSTGEVIVTIDSDSLITPKTLRRLVSPFYHNPSVGAVAGNVRVLNRKDGIIPRMMDVLFAYSFEFIRTSQSVVNSVFCTPGALAAYRKDALMKIVDNWYNQTFFGRPANIGEDRSLTNWILRTGHFVTFQADSAVYTKVPVGYKGLCKMLLRWARSNVRETLVMSSFIFKKFRNTSATGARINFILSWINLVIPQFLLGGMMWCIAWKPELFLIQVLLGASIAACVPAFFYIIRRGNSNAIWAFAHNIFWVTGLFWITPYSIMTMRNDRWLTRDIEPQNAPSKAPAASQPLHLLGHPAAS